MSFGIYIHWPFCLSKCPYCDFNSHVHDTIDHEAFAKAYLREINYIADMTKGSTVETVFFGGGTPSLMKPETVAMILDAIKSHWNIAPDWEVTLEANPTSSEAEKFKAFKAAGVNRLSLGIQSLRSEDLKFLGRTHDTEQAREAIQMAADTFDRFSFDLIYARPQQTVEAWKEELHEALQIAAGHISLYQLTIEKNTPFFVQHARGEFKIPAEELAADFYDATEEIMKASGFETYEVSNYARPGQQSRHNLIYWRYGDYAGIGPGAHGRLTLDGKKYATRTHRAPDIWLQRVEAQGHSHHEFELIEPVQRLQEAVMMGLRLEEGVPLSRLQSEYGGNPFDIIEQRKISKLCDEGLLIFENDIIRTTHSGRKCLNGVLDYLLN
ncbi:MAG: coproporphyrinogen III oxidase [Micavibrio aeruginosavorus]|uniref:Heme chaperone HemW n=1 Tax=Micavibrio aeruginosavorus TaxID=349221 RepID=A0A2W5FLL9_9BACT|nr:MAG: coproporphyrinogen III oxidase [Micavibrio aeruginosavorus]